MPSEERNGELANRQEATMEPSFDTLAKELANGTVSRGKALRLMGAALVGGALASIPGVAWAARCPSPRIRCAGQCCAAGVTTCQGTGKNKTCGPVPCPAGQELCNVVGDPAQGQCVTNTCQIQGMVYNPASCDCECPPGQGICNNACVPVQCAVGQFFNETTCQCENVQVVSNCCVCGDPTNPSNTGCGSNFRGDEAACQAFCAGYSQYTFMANATCATLSDSTWPGVCQNQGQVCKSNVTGCPSGTNECINGSGTSQCVYPCPSGTNLDPFDCTCKNGGCSTDADCPFDQVCTNGTCGGGGCKCRTVECNGLCVNECTQGQTLNPTTCLCEG